MAESRILQHLEGTADNKDRHKMTLQELENQVAKLSPEELAAFREWWLRFDGDRWDEQIDQDVSSGKLDALGRDAIQELRSGRSNPL